MFLLYSLIILLLSLTIVSYYLADRDILSTPVTLCMAFLGTCCMASIYADVWLLQLSEMTALVIFTGVLSFVVGYFFIFIYKGKRIKKVYNINELEDEIQVNKLATFVFVILEMISVYGSYNYVDSVTSLFIATDNLIEKIGIFHIVIMDQEITTKINIPHKERLYGWLEEFCCVGAYIYMYIMAHDYIYLRKVKWYFIPIIILYLFNSLLTGGRFNTIATLMSLGIFFYVFDKRKKGWKNGVKLKSLLKYGFLLIIMLFFFPLSMMLLGRSDMEISIDTIGIVFEETMYNLAVYVGAEIKLLDIFVTETYVNVTYDDPLGSHTLSRLYKFIAGLFDIREWQGIGSGDIPFANVNGYFLGNVYTMFRAYMTDGGVIGVIVFSFIMGFVFAYFYHKVKYNYNGNSSNKIDGNLLIYSYIYFCVPLSFFSNWFYWLIAPSLLRMVMCFYICKFFLLKNKK